MVWKYGKFEWGCKAAGCIGGVGESCCDVSVKVVEGGGDSPISLGATAFVCVMRSESYERLILRLLRMAGLRSVALRPLCKLEAYCIQLPQNDVGQLRWEADFCNKTSELL